MQALIADDQVLSRDVATAQLRMLGFEVTATRDSSEAMATISERGPFALVLIDWQLGAPHGEALIRHIRSLPRTHETCICLWSRAPTQEHRELAIGCGANSILPKPIGLRELATHLALLGLRPLHG